MTPVIAIVGCPNVGKSTLFNRLTRSRAALVADRPGVTRDRRYGYARLNGREALLVDTGGIAGAVADDEAAPEQVSEQTMRAINEADAVVWLTDARAGVTAGDLDLAEILRPLTKPVTLAVNKVDGLNAAAAAAEFHALGGFGNPLGVSAEAGAGINALAQALNEHFPARETPARQACDATRIAIVGRPNVGKSTLINRLLGEDRMLTGDAPGTTRDSIEIPLRRRNKDYLLIDTAGIRRRHKVTDKIEKFSVIQSLRAIEASQVVILTLDARDVIAAQDQTLLGMINRAGKALIIALNKWDGLKEQQKSAIRQQLDRKAAFLDYACRHRVSALYGTGVEKLLDIVDRVTRSQQRSFSAATMTRLLEEALAANPPPLARGRPIKLKYAHLGGCDPMRVVIHGNQTRDVPTNYRRYLANHLRIGMQLVGAPVLVEFKHGDNPYKTFRNTLTRRQSRKRRRIIRHARRK